MTKGIELVPEAKAKNTWQIVLPIGALTLLGALMLSVSNEAAVALKTSEQHGDSILLLREEVRLLRDELKGSYSASDAEKDLTYIRRDMEELKQLLKEHDNK